VATSDRKIHTFDRVPWQFTRTFDLTRLVPAQTQLQLLAAIAPRLLFAQFGEGEGVELDLQSGHVTKLSLEAERARVAACAQISDSRSHKAERDCPPSLRAQSNFTRRSPSGEWLVVSGRTLRLFQPSTTDSGDGQDTGSVLRQGESWVCAKTLPLCPANPSIAMDPVGCVVFADGTCVTASRGDTALRFWSS
jgi:hypothetical protein